MKIKLLGALIFSLFFSSVILAQNGTVQGTVTESINGQIQPIPFANVFLLGTTRGGTTDFDGKYTFVAEPGNYKLVVSFTGYIADTVGIEIKPGETVTQNMTARKNAEVLKTVNVVAKMNRESEAALQMERKNSEGLEERIGADELSKKSAGNVSEGLTKMSGVSSVGAGNIFVRGLGDRYNNAYLNGILLPSPNPDKKVIPMNLIPTAVVSSLTVGKTFTADQFGDVSGASINIETKSYPEQGMLDVYVGAGMNTQTTGRGFTTYNGGKYDYFGFDDGTRNVPSSLDPSWNSLNNPPSNRYDSRDPNKNPASPGIPFQKNFNPIFKNAPLNSKFGVKGGNFYGTNKNDKSEGFGFILLGAFENKSINISGIHRVINAQDSRIIDYDYNSSIQKTSTSALASAYYRFSHKSEIKFTSLFINLSNDETRETDGFHWDYDQLGDIFTRRYTYRQSNLWTNQLVGKHAFLANDKLKFDWAVAYQTTGLKEPDRRQLVWYHDKGADRKDYQFHTFDVADQHRYFMYLNEKEYNAAANFSYSFKQDDEDPSKSRALLSFGYQGRIKSRQQDFRFYSHNVKVFNEVSGLESVDANSPDTYLNDDYHQQGAYYQREESNPESANEGSLTVHAGYVSFNFFMASRWQVVAGVRVEKSLQEVRYRLQSSPLDPIFVKSSVIDTLAILPTLSIKFNATKKSAFRFAASQTTTRPNFKELAPFQYRAFFGGKVQQGNPDLHNSSNTNIDLRYEIYPKSGDLYSVTVFGRYIQNPIEQVTLGSASGILMSYQNAKSAQVAGVELEAVHKLRNSLGSNSFFKDFAVGFNLSYIYSKVEINTTSGVTNNNPNRPLEGASPWLANIDLAYEKRFSPLYKLTTALSYNYRGKRLFAVGRQNIGDSYQMAVNTMNFTLRNEIGRRWEFNISADNLLNPQINIEQESTQGNDNTVIDSFKLGVDLNATLVFKVF